MAGIKFSTKISKDLKRAAKVARIMAGKGGSLISPLQGTRRSRRVANKARLKLQKLA